MYKKQNWELMDPIQVWNYVRSGKLKTFPNNFLDKEACKQILRFLVFEELNLKRQDILKINLKYLYKYNLAGVRSVFGNKIHNILSFCFPELYIKEWELPKVYPGFWKNKNNRTKFVKWVAKQENLNLSKIEDIRKISVKLIKKYGGSKPLSEAGSLFELIYPATNKKLRLQEWQLTKINNWDKSKAIKAVKWLIEERLKWTKEQVYENLSTSIFYQNDLGGLLCKFFHHSILEAIQFAYPGEYPYGLKKVKPKSSHD